MKNTVSKFINFSNVNNSYYNIIFNNKNYNINFKK